MYLEGDFPTSADKETISLLEEKDVKDHPNTYAWFQLIQKFSDKIKESWPLTEVEISSKSDEVECFYSVSSFGRYIDGMLEVIIGPCLGEFGDINIEKEIIPLTKIPNISRLSDQRGIRNQKRRSQRSIQTRQRTCLYQEQP